MKKRFSFMYAFLVLLLLGLIAIGVYAFIKGAREHEIEMQYVLQFAKAGFGLA